MIPCTYCNKKFKYQSEKVRHELSHSQQFECGVCSKKFSFISALHRHEKQHKRTNPACCSKCGRSFRDETLVKRHMKYAHSGTYICTKCKGTFHSKIALDNHMKIHRPESLREHRCDYEGCTKTFNFAHNLLNHKLTHTNTKKYFCNVCEKGFVQSNNLKIHLKTHDESSKWMYCDIKGCNKKFSSVSARDKHLLLHGKMKPEIVVSPVLTNKYLCENDNKVQNQIEDNTNSNVFNNNEYLDLSEFTTKEDLNVEKKAIDEIENDPIDFTMSTNDIDPSIRSCKAVLGCCIVTEDNDTCLCAQMNESVNEPKMNEDANSNPAFITCNKSEDFNKNSSKCNTCPCHSICESANKQGIAKDIDATIDQLMTRCDTDMPKIQYKSDGTIKLDVTFDMDTDTQADPKYTPMNSCRDILGKCIVSGNTTMGEGCLCAKMMNDDCNVNTEEIDEITPCPKRF